MKVKMSPNVAVKDGQAAGSHRLLLQGTGISPGNYGDTLRFKPISTDLNLHPSFWVKQMEQMGSDTIYEGLIGQTQEVRVEAPGLDVNVCFFLDSPIECLLNRCPLCALCSPRAGRIKTALFCFQVHQ